MTYVTNRSVVCRSFAQPDADETAVLELTAIIAMLVWAIVAWLAGRLIWLVLSRPR